MSGDGATYTVYGTDGTAAGTQTLFRTIAGADGNSGVELLSSAAGSLTIAGWSGYTTTVYGSDGTSAGTSAQHTGTFDTKGNVATNDTISRFLFQSYNGNPGGVAWTGESKYWIGDVWTFNLYDSSGNLLSTVTIFPNWTAFLLPSSVDNVAVSYPGVLNENITTSVGSLTVGAASVLNITGQLTVSASVTNKGLILLASGASLSAFGGINNAGGTISLVSGAFLSVFGGISNASGLINLGDDGAASLGTSAAVSGGKITGVLTVNGGDLFLGNGVVVTGTSGGNGTIVVGSNNFGTLGRVDKVYPLFDRSQLGKAEKTARGMIISGGNAPAVLEPVEKALDPVSGRIQGPVDRVLYVPVLLGGNLGCAATCANLVADGVTVVTLVGQHDLGISVVLGHEVGKSRAVVGFAGR